MLLIVFLVFYAFSKKIESNSALKTSPFLSLLICLFAFPSTALEQLNFQVAQNSQDYPCPLPLLERMQRHKIAPGENIDSIARQHNLLPDTLIDLNPSLAKGSASVGKEILIPPFNGIRLEVPPGASWKDLEAAYGVRADVLFEINGCQKVPKFIFLPGVNWESPAASQANNYTGLSSYPLSSIATVGLTYGWQTQATLQQRLFHTGIDFLADLGTPVLSAEAGMVAFVGQENNYGNLVVINHQGGWQTRYGHLASIKVKIGQEVKAGETIGTVGSTGVPDLRKPHLHFEVRRKTPLGWIAQDPQNHLQRRQNNNPTQVMP